MNRQIRKLGIAGLVLFGILFIQLNNIQVLSELLPGALIADMVAILGSLFFVVGDIDK